MRKILRFLVPILLVGAGVAIFMQLKSSGPEDMPAVVTERQWPVDAVRVEFRELRPTVRLYGRLESPAESRIRSALSTDVSASFALVGKAVGKGDVLLQLDDVDATLALAQREAELAEIEARIESENSRYRNDLAALSQEQQLLALAQNALARAEKLAQTQAGTQANADNAQEAVARQTLSLSNRRYAIADHPPRLAQLQARRQQAQAQRDQAARNLERTRVTAPFAGRITAVHVSPGDRVRPGDRLVDLFDTTSLEVRAQVPNRHLNAIRQSLADGITIDATAMMDGSEFTLELARLSAKIESGEGGVDAFFRFRGDRPTLELGRTMAVLVTLPREGGVFALPATAIYGADSAYRIRDGRLERVRLQRVGGYRNGEWGSWSLFRGKTLEAGDILLANQLPNAVEGLGVEVISLRN